MMSLVAVIELQLGASLTTTKATMHRWLSLIARECNLARNAMMEAWLIWRRQNPNWTPQQRRDRYGQLKVNKKGDPIIEDNCISQEMENQLYHIGRKAAPNVAAKIIASCRSEVVDKLRAKMPYNHTGEAKLFWEAILIHEVSIPSYRSVSIPVPTQDALFAYDGAACGSPGMNGERQKFIDIGTDNPIVRFPLFSSDSDVKDRQHIARVEVRQLSAGNRRLLKRIASGEIKFSDSEIVQKDDGRWSFQLVYKVPETDHGLDPKREAILTPTPPGSKWPFELKFSDETVKPWGLGDGAIYRELVSRLNIRRKVMRRRFRHGGAKGHGKKAFYDKLRPRSRAVIDMQETIQKWIVADVLKQLIRHDCGTFVYREPSLGFRPKLWFGDYGLDFAWDKFGGMLRHKLEANGIKIPKHWPRIKSKEHREEYVEGWKASKNAKKKRGNDGDEGKAA